MASSGMVARVVLIVGALGGLIAAAYVFDPQIEEGVAAGLVVGQVNHEHKTTNTRNVQVRLSGGTLVLAPDRSDLALAEGAAVELAVSRGRFFGQKSYRITGRRDQSGE